MIRWLTWASVGATLAMGAPAAAQAAELSIDPAGPQALGKVFTAGPTPRAVYLLSSGGYGYTGGVLGQDDSHHRLGGALGVEGRPAPWLGLGLRLDGRYDWHSVPGQPGDDGWVGDPRAFLRLDRAVQALRFGVRLGLWLPGRNAPSVDFDAITAELLGAASYVPPSVPISVSVNLGYRRDRTALTARDARLLSASDRLALQVSDFDQALLGVAATIGRRATQAFIEGSWDILVGDNSPPLSVSPLRLGAGLRWAAGPQLQLEGAVVIVPSGRPATDVTAPLSPVPPRAEVCLGMTYRFGTVAPAPARAVPPAPPPPAAQPAPAEVQAGPPDDDDAAKTSPAPALPSGQLRGLVRSLKGRGVTAEIRIEPTGQVLETRDGRFEVDVAPGRYDVTITAPGYQSQTRQVQVEQNGVTLLNVDLRSEK